VVGVFIGLQVQQWADAQRQARLERAYTERLQAEVLSLMATRAPLVEARNRFNEALATATQAAVRRSAAGVGRRRMPEHRLLLRDLESDR
jgi:hypothetical protein